MNDPYDAEEVYNLIKEAIEQGRTKSYCISLIEAYAEKRIKMKRRTKMNKL